MDASSGSSWTAPGTVAGFATAPPNPVLMAFAAREQPRGRRGLVVDLGCGAGRNAVPLAQTGWDVVGVDLSRPMLEAAAERARSAGVSRQVWLVLASADRVPLEKETADLVVAHGIWNLAATVATFRRSVAEAARVARPHAGLFVFTFSRHTLPAEAEPMPGEPFVFTEFSGQPQCFLTELELLAELDAAGFGPEPSVRLTEYNRQDRPLLHGRAPVLWEAAFRKR